MKIIRFLAAIFFITLIYPSLTGREIRYFSMRDGLSSRQVYALEEDSDGFICQVVGQVGRETVRRTLLG